MSFLWYFGSSNETLRFSFSVDGDCISFSPPFVSSPKLVRILRYGLIPLNGGKTCFVFVRKAIVKQRVLQQCLRMKRECRTFTDNNLGVYGGKPLYTYSRDIDKFIADQHPRRRRVRVAEKALKQSIRRGKISEKELPYLNCH